MKTRKNIDIDESVLTKLKLLAVFEELSVKSLMEKAISLYVTYKESELLKSLSDEEKEEFGLLLHMQQVDRHEVASRDEVINYLNSSNTSFAKF